MLAKNPVSTRSQQFFKYIEVFSPRQRISSQESSWSWSIISKYLLFGDTVCWWLEISV